MTDEDLPVRGQIRSVDFRRVSHGLFLKKLEGLSEDDEFIRDLCAMRLLLPEGAVYTHLTAARIRGWDIPHRLEVVPIFAAVRGASSCPRRPGLICSRLTHDAPAGEVRGLPVDAAEEILLRAARDLGVLDLVVLIDSARRHRHLDLDKMEQLLASRRPGVRRLREAYALSSNSAESAPETVLRMFVKAMEVRVNQNVPLLDGNGRLIAVSDLKVVGMPHLLEYDGNDHRTPQQHAKDLRRDRGISSAGYQRHAFTLDDLLNHPIRLMHELDRMLDRPHDLGRTRAWRAVVGESMFSRVGRIRLVARWRRQMGYFDWSGTG